MKKHKLLILGTRGIPGSHGGFETFAERLALYLVRRGWKVTVYCQSDEEKLSYSIWQGINLVHIPVPKDNSFWSILFDFKAAFHAVRQEGLILTLGYNTAIFSLLYRLRNRTNMTNMDGMEWWRKKWNALEKSWLYINERCAVWFSNHLIADHPQIKRYLRTQVKTSKPIAVIPYSTEIVTEANPALLQQYNLVPQNYALVIARPEPENSILEIVSAFSRQKRNMPLVVLGKYLPEENPYHKEVLKSASDEVMFVGGIYNQEVVTALRYYASLYLHGHQVGGTNPSLIEAMSAGSPVLAHNNPFNSWVAGEGAAYFKDMDDCDRQMTQLLHNKAKLQLMKQSSLDRYDAKFADDKDLKAHEQLFLATLNPRHNQILVTPQESSKEKSLV
ncbi:DUF1972 domain-containing protein [Waterburya agarophytonicola K14]|uniref:DUF1972 domain-containing protein n=1 Tax=Waterburya agarophytonicola KI4 TaxID=2874699 RepID=A0A964BNP6_9CYAN|nr:DUF1972 domain-containing protein [Waterburya agarophytonicola]MCC0176454.1 DUF1972 domain-containing protein [Waterburya agarophytonicola KI4]